MTKIRVVKTAQDPIAPLFRTVLEVNDGQRFSLEMGDFLVVGEKGEVEVHCGDRAPVVFPDRGHAVDLSHFLWMVENVHVTKEELLLAIKSAQDIAHGTHAPQVLSYAGLFDVVVWPNGELQLIPFTSFKRYSLEKVEEVS